MNRSECEIARVEAAKMIRESGITISDEEAGSIEVADFGLGNLKKEGAQILTLVQTDRIGIKVIALFPNQVLPEHWHPRVGDDPGKEETIRVAKGILYLYLPGNDNESKAPIPDGKKSVYTCRHEITMNLNDQLTIQPGCKHWFKAGNEGAVVFSYSTVARDILDQFSDPDIVRVTKISD